MSENTKNRFVIALMAILVFGLSAFGILSEDGLYSYSERRVLKKFPEITESALLSGTFMSDFEDYSMDQFPLRDTFRSIKAYAKKYVFHQKDNNGYYLVQGHLSKLEYPDSPAKQKRNKEIMDAVYKNYIEGSDCNVYLSIIPDKNYFLAVQNGYPSLDYESLLETFNDSRYRYIDVFDTLDLNSYYYGDQHFAQERILDTAKRIASAMNVSILQDYSVNRVETPFTGSYVGQAALGEIEDTLYYLNNDLLENCSVVSWGSGKEVETSIYVPEKAQGRDGYEMYLGGADPMIIINNPSGKEDKELVVFRDSFGSSLVPLLISDYSKVTVVDLRYMQISMLKNFVEFDHQDVLFVYSTLILNNSIAMN